MLYLTTFLRGVPSNLGIICSSGNDPVHSALFQRLALFQIFVFFTERMILIVSAVGM